MHTPVCIPLKHVTQHTTPHHTTPHHTTSHHTTSTPRPRLGYRSGGGASSKHKWHARFRITDKYTPEVVYFDSLLPGLSGRIKICDLKASDKKCHARARATSYFMDAPVKLPPLHKPSLYDQSCGTSNLSPFQPGEGYDKFCKGNVFMCSDEKNYDQFASCFDAVNCAMHDQMKVEHTGNCQELFINQMIPHHQNAVNMAKIVLKFAEAELTSGGLSIPCAHDKKARCPDLDALGLLRSIIASQNSQIHFMRHYLATSVKGARATPSFCVRRHDDAVGATGLRIESPKASIEVMDVCTHSHTPIHTYTCMKTRLLRLSQIILMEQALSSSRTFSITPLFPLHTTPTPARV